ncbi:MFS transporter [Rhizobium terrae]|uniref:MFS transporter n=1 Tax=Rhizobium terrae TaxID=2171756 RepID=UPI0013C351FA|nr:MFS transporter [Rhizobium terrae]
MSQDAWLPAGKHHPFLPAALRHSQFRRYTIASTISLAGLWIHRTALGWYIWELTQSGFWLGLLLLAELVPAFVFTPFGGVLVDRHGSHRVIMATQTVFTVQGAVLGLLISFADIGPELALAFAAIGGSLAAVRLPATLAILSDLLPTEDRAQGSAIVSIVLNLTRMTGPGLGGLIIAHLGVAEAFMSGSACGIAFLLGVRGSRPIVPPHPAAGTAPRDRPWTAIRQGIDYIRATPQLRLVFIIYGITALGVRPFYDMLPGLAADLAGGSATTLAGLGASFGLGSLLAALFIAGRVSSFSSRSIIAASMGAALSVLSFAVAPIFEPAAFAAASAGFFTVLAGVGSQTIIQTTADSHIRGRLLSLFSLIFLSGSAAGAFAIGLLSELTGLRMSIGSTSIVAILFTGGVALRSRS